MGRQRRYAAVDERGDVIYDFETPLLRSHAQLSCLFS
jgi:hypothetical protein